MPLPPAQPPAQPPVQQPPQERPAKPVKQQNPFDVTYTNNSESNSKSEAENAVVQNGTQTNVQNNFGHLNYIQIRDVRLPSEWAFHANSNYTSSGESIHTVGVTWQPQGKAKKYAHRHLEMEHTNRQTSMCVGLIKNGIAIDYEARPDLAFCKGLGIAYAPTVAPPAPQVDQERLEAELKIKQLQLQLEQMNQRLQRLQPEFNGSKG